MDVQQLQDKARLISNSIFVWSDTHRRATLGIACFVVGFIAAKIF